MKPFAPLPTVSTLAWILAACCGASCVSSGDGGAENSMDAGVPELFLPAEWTTAFMEPAMLFADRIYVEGPQGLLDHLATRVSDEYHSYDAETLPEGFRQVFTVDNKAMGVELRAYLDRLELVVFEELTVIEKPGKIDVLIRAEGDVYWRNSTTLEERRAGTLSFSGEIEPLAGVSVAPENSTTNK